MTLISYKCIYLFILKFFFSPMWAIFTVFIEFATTLLLFYGFFFFLLFLIFWPQSM